MWEDIHRLAEERHQVIGEKAPEPLTQQLEEARERLKTAQADDKQASEPNHDSSFEIRTDKVLKVREAWQKDFWGRDFPDPESIANERRIRQDRASQRPKVVVARETSTPPGPFRWTAPATTRANPSSVGNLLAPTFHTADTASDQHVTQRVTAPTPRIFHRRPRPPNPYTTGHVKETAPFSIRGADGKIKSLKDKYR